MSAPLPPNRDRRRTFKSFADAPRDGTPFHVPYIFRYNPFAKTYEALLRDQYSGELEWASYPRLFGARYFCDLLPLSYELPKSFAMTFVARSVRPTLRQRITRRWLGCFYDITHHTLFRDIVRIGK